MNGRQYVLFVSGDHRQLGRFRYFPTFEAARKALLRLSDVADRTVCIGKMHPSGYCHEIIHRQDPLPIFRRTLLTSRARS